MLYDNIGYDDDKCAVNEDSGDVCGDDDGDDGSCGGDCGGDCGGGVSNPIGWFFLMFPSYWTRI